jgi:flagellar biosynthesis/type III secretory pathway M-ring protein FliF/YscJ
MAAAGTETTEATVASAPLERARAALARLDNRQKVVLMVAIAALIALLVAAATLLRQSEFRILFSNVGERDGGAIIAALEQMNVPFRFNDSGSAILVPAARVHDVRLRLASQGLPRGGAVGFELMESQKFGISQFAEQLNYQRGLEGELSRTVQSIAAVEAARVHLAIPKPSVFMREELKPSASVMLRLYPGRSLDAAQIAGIQNLVAASVPQLSPASVTLLDQSGTLLSQMKSKLLEAGLDPTQVKYVNEIEASIIRRVEDILTPIVGAGNARVQVAADIDFSQSEHTAETHRPNTTPPEISIRSQQTNESASTSPTAQGVPGALSNQPPVPATAPLTQPAVPPAAGRRTDAAAGTDQCRRRAGADRQRRPAADHEQEFDHQLRGRQDDPPRPTVDRQHQAPVGSGGGQSAQGNRQGRQVRQQTAARRRAKADQRPRQGGDGFQQGPGRHDLGGQRAVHRHREGRWRSALARPGNPVAGKGTRQVRGHRRHHRLPPARCRATADADDGRTASHGEDRSAARSTSVPKKKAKRTGSGEHVPTASELLERQLAAVRALAQQDPQAVANIIKQWTGANAG